MLHSMSYLKCHLSNNNILCSPSSRCQTSEMALRILLVYVIMINRGCNCLTMFWKSQVFRTIKARAASKSSLTAQPLTYRCGSSKEVEQLGYKLSTILDCGDVLFLQGDLGAGKTTFSRGIVRSKFQDNHMVVTSPSYLLDNTYQYGKEKYIHHMDLYRLPVGYKEMGILGIPAIFSSALCVIEWPNRLVGENIPESYLDVTISIPAAKTITHGSGDLNLNIDNAFQSSSGYQRTDIRSTNQHNHQPKRDNFFDGEESDEDYQDADSDAEENNTNEERLVTITTVGKQWSSKSNTLRSLLGEPEFL